MVYMAGHFLGLVGLVGVFYLTGWLFEPLLMDRRALEPISIEVRFGLGAAVWMGCVFLLASLQMLTASVLGVATLVTLVVVWRQRQVTSRLFLKFSEAPPPARRNTLVWLLGGLVAATVAVLWLQVLRPQISWDSNVYHLTVPRLYLEHGGFKRIPFNVYSNWPLNTQMLYALAMTAKDYVLAKSVHFAFGLATLLLVYRLVKDEARAWAGWLAGILFLVNPVVLDEFRTAYVDLSFAFFLLLAFALIHFWLEERGAQTRLLVLAGVFCGVAGGIKPTGITGAISLLGVYLVASWRQGRGSQQILGGLARIVVPAGLVMAPWVIKTWIMTGNPVYPFLYPALGGPEWSAGLTDQFKEWQQGMGMGRGWLDYLLLPIRVILAGDRGYEHFDGRLSPLWLVLIPLALLFGRRRALVTRSLGVAGIYFFFWSVSSQQMRFLIPVVPFLAIASALSLVEVGRRLKEKARPFFEWSVSLVAVATLGLVFSSMVMPSGMAFRQYLEQGDDIMQSAVHPVYRFIEEELPADARLLFLNTNHGYFCRRNFVADSFFEASQINDLLQAEEGVAGVEAVMQDLEVTHLLIENRDRFVPWPQSLFEYLNDPARVRQIYRSPDSTYDVVEIAHPRESKTGV